MKFSCLLFLLLSSTISYAQKVDTTLINYEGNYFYHITNNSNANVIVFLHGGVINPIFKDTTTRQDLDFLLEGNKMFTTTAINSGYDVIIPITNDSLNWLINHSYCFQIIKEYLSKSKRYESHVISGFSDGGTGSYKMFYDNHDFFAGLIVFNGFPQHQNFYKSVNYTSITTEEIIFFSTLSDKRIPYEFLLTEYAKQKISNANTYLYVKEGSHSFDAYGKEDFDLCFDILTKKINNTNNEAIHGFIKNDSLIEFYPYRKKIKKQFGYGDKYFLINKKQKKLYGRK